MFVHDVGTHVAPPLLLPLLLPLPPPLLLPLLLPLPLPLLLPLLLPLPLPLLLPLPLPLLLPLPLPLLLPLPPLLDESSTASSSPASVLGTPASVPSMPVLSSWLGSSSDADGVLSGVTVGCSEPESPPMPMQSPAQL
jgi:hypothetical protein